MSTEDIIAELQKLSPAELQLVKTKLEELTLGPRTSQKSVQEVLLNFAGRAHGLPSDFAHNHNHYLYGKPKPQQ